MDNLNCSTKDSESYKNSSIIGIDEAQFFTDLKDFIIKSEKMNKIIILAGLDGDYLRKPFGQILECIPLCDDLLLLKAMCRSKDPVPTIICLDLIVQNLWRGNSSLLYGR